MAGQSYRRSLGLIAVGIAALPLASPAWSQSTSGPAWTLYGIGDSLTHGTMDATNNWVHTSFGFMQRVAGSLRQVTTLRFTQPFLDFQGRRLAPFRLPTNFGVDGADVFTIAGLEYYKRVGAVQSVPSTNYLADRFLPSRLDDLYDRVLYPSNLLAGRALSQIGAAVWSFAQNAASPIPNNEAVIYWIGNNDSSLATLGTGGSNPTFLAIPYQASKAQLTQPLVSLFELGLQAGLISFEPYSQASIDRNMTDASDFQAQAASTLGQLVAAPVAPGARRDIFVLTLPYYTSVGYLCDSEDLEYYFQKLDPTYTVPPTFARVAPQGQPILDPFQGDRVSLLTFGFMYVLLSTGSSVAEVNLILEQNGQQMDGLVLSRAEQQAITDRTDEYNQALVALAASFGGNVHVVDTGGFLLDALTGPIPIVVGGKTLSRKWVRGSALSLDGVHPNYTAQAAIANFLLAHMNFHLSLAAPPSELLATQALDPYVDRDGDGFAPGPGHTASGITELLYLLSDPDDTNPALEPVLPADVWSLLSNAMLGEVLRVPELRSEAARLGLPAVGRSSSPSLR